MFKFILISIPVLFIGLIIWYCFITAKENKEKKIKNKEKYLSEKHVNDFLNPTEYDTTLFYDNDITDFWKKRLSLAKKRNEYIYYYLSCYNNNLKVPTRYKNYENNVYNFSKKDVLEIYNCNKAYIQNIEDYFRGKFPKSKLQFVDAEKVRRQSKDRLDYLLSSYVISAKEEKALCIFYALKYFYNNNH